MKLIFVLFLALILQSCSGSKISTVDSPHKQIENGLITDSSNCKDVQGDSDILACAQLRCEKIAKRKLEDPSKYSFQENTIRFIGQTKTVLLSNKIFYKDSVDQPYYAIYYCTVAGNRILNFQLKKNSFDKENLRK